MTIRRIDDVAVDHAYTSSSDSIATTGATKISLDTTKENQLGYLDAANNEFLIEEDGVYMMTGVIGFDNVEDQAEYKTRLFSSVSMGEAGTMASVTSPGPEIGAVVKTTRVLNAGDTLSMFGINSGGSSVPTAVGAQNTYLNLVRLKRMP